MTRRTGPRSKYLAWTILLAGGVLAYAAFGGSSRNASPARTPLPTRTTGPTLTPSITYTPSVTDTASATFTATNTSAPGPTDTPRPTGVPGQTLYPSERTYFVTGGSVNVRLEPSTASGVIFVAQRGAALAITGEQRGMSVNGSDLWYRVTQGEAVGYIHSSLVSATRPTTAAPRPTKPPAPDAPKSTSVPAQPVQPVSTQLPAPVSQPNDAQICGGATRCDQMASCEQAYACLRAGRSSLDRDNDGVPCESICPGG